MPLQGSVMTLEFWNLCNFLYSFENYLILIVSIVYPYIMLLHILISENFNLWAFWVPKKEDCFQFCPLMTSTSANGRSKNALSESLPQNVHWKVNRVSQIWQPLLTSSSIIALCEGILTCKYGTLNFNHQPEIWTWNLPHLAILAIL